MTDTQSYGGPSEPTEDHPEEWVSISQAAVLTHLSVSTLRRYDLDGRLKAGRTPGNLRRYRRSDLLAFSRITPPEDLAS